MLTTEDKEEIKRIVVETLAESGVSSNQERNSNAEAQSIAEIAARAMEIFGSRERALKWLNAPVRSLGDRTPLSLLNTPEGITQVEDTLGRIEHGVW